MENEKMNELLNLEKNAVDKSMEITDVIEKEVAFDFEKHIDDSKPSAVIVNTEIEEEKKPRRKAKKISAIRFGQRRNGCPGACRI